METIIYTDLKPILIEVEEGKQVFKKEIEAIAEFRYKGYIFYLNDAITSPKYPGVSCAITGRKLPIDEKLCYLTSSKLPKLKQQVKRTLETNWNKYLEYVNSKQETPICIFF